MEENYSLNQKRKKEKNTTCTLSKCYTITIPKLIRETLDLMSGDEIIISSNSEQLIIQKLNEHTLENIMILNNRGSVKIPQEFINLLSLENGDTFILSMSNSSIVLKKK